MLRHRKNTIDKVVQKMDAFTKVPEDYVEPSVSGALGMLWLLCLRICVLGNRDYETLKGSYWLFYCWLSHRSAKCSIVHPRVCEIHFKSGVKVGWGHCGQCNTTQYMQRSSLLQPWSLVFTDYMTCNKHLSASWQIRSELKRVSNVKRASSSIRFKY